MIAKKNDQNKVRMDLLPPDSLKEIAKVLTYGANKYGKDNWVNGFEYHRIYGALQRHLNAFWSGKDIDEDSGLSHLACAGANILILLSHVLRKIGKDDRFINIVNKENNSDKKDINKDNAKLYTINVDNIIYIIEEEYVNNNFLYTFYTEDKNHPFYSKFTSKTELNDYEAKKIIRKNKFKIDTMRENKINSDIKETVNNNTINSMNNLYSFSIKIDEDKDEEVIVVNYIRRKLNKNKIEHVYFFVDNKTGKNLFTKSYSTQQSKVNLIEECKRYFEKRYIKESDVIEINGIKYNVKRINDNTLSMDYKDNRGNKHIRFYQNNGLSVEDIIKFLGGK